MSEKLTRNFTTAEMTCRCGCRSVDMSPSFLAMLQKMRDIYGQSMTVNSGYRCEAHNKAEGGRPASAHLSGYAADIAVSGARQRSELLDAARRAGFNRIGIARSFVHVDCGPDLPEDVVWLYG